MDQQIMQITLSRLDKDTLYLQDGNGDLIPQVGQQVNFINIINGGQLSSDTPTKIEYSDVSSDSIAILNYENVTINGTVIEIKNGLQPIISSSAYGFDIYKQEVIYNAVGEIIPVTTLEPVIIDTNSFSLQDYNISNNRIYRYIIYPTLSESTTILSAQDQIIKTNWGNWSITELHPTDSINVFSVSPSDVWLFKYNVETGDQTQNINRNQQQTLGQYARYTQGQQNYVSGSVSCLLGQEFTSMEYLIKNGIEIVQGGYQEILPFTSPLSSNDKVSMLYQWRKIVASTNPKLLKDRKGQAFLVTLTDNKNKPMDDVAYQPDTISFSWHQIGTPDGIQIINTNNINN